MAMGARTWRLVGLGLVGVLLAAWASYGPFLFATCCHPVVTPFNQAWRLVSWLVWVCLLLVVYAREPTGPMWKLVLARLAVGGMWVIGYAPPDLLWTIERYRDVGDVVFGHIVLAFPTGRLTHRFDTNFIRFAYAYVIGFTTLALLFWVVPADWGRTNVFALWPNETIHRVVSNVGLAGAPILAGVVLWRLWRRYHAATPTMRRILAPVVVTVPIAMAMIGLWYVADLIDRDEIRVLMQGPLSLLASFLLPAGLLIGALRTRLARGSVADLAVELSGGLPLGGLQPVLARALRDPTLVIAYPAPEGGGYVDQDGQPVDLDHLAENRASSPLRRGDEVLAVLVHDSNLEAENPGLVRAVGSVAELALTNERLSAQVRAQLAEVRASRTRIVEAADAERSRIERDLHDGAQQRLLALAMRLQTAKVTGRQSDQLLDEATAELEAAVGEVRELARGLHPPILGDLGLAPALDALAERTPIPVEVRAPDRRYPESVERAIYFLVSESLTNVVRYAQATSVRVNVRDDDRTLSVEVRDDGRGGADPSRGSGLRGLTDRVAALGGEMTVESVAGQGTSIRAAFSL